MHRECLHRYRSWQHSQVIKSSLDASVSISLKHILLASNASSLPTTSDSELKTCFAYTFTSDESAFCNHTECFSQQTNQRCTGRLKHVFAVANIPARVSNIGSPVLQNLNTRSIIHSTDFCFVLSIMFFPELAVNALNVRLSRGPRSIFFIAYVSLRRFIAFFS